MAAAAMAVVATGRHVHGERATPPRLDAGSCNADNFRTIAPNRLKGWNPSRLKTCSIVISLRTLSKSTPAHGSSSLRDETSWCVTTVPFPLSLWGTGTILSNRSAEPLPTSRRAAEPAGPLERLQHLAQTLVLDRQRITQLRSRQHRPRARRSSTRSSRLRCFRSSSSSSAITSRWVVSALVATSSR